MSRNKKERNRPFTTLMTADGPLTGDYTSQDENARGLAPRVFAYLKAHFAVIGAIAFVLLLGLGVMARNGWLPNTDPLSGKKTGWFGQELPKNASSTWNPFAAPLPAATSLSKEYIYAGSRLLAVEDANANAAPPADLAVWRPGSGTWYVMGGPGSQSVVYNWGTTGDKPVPGDYDGDGKTDFTIFRGGQWWVTRSSDNTFYVINLGATSDMTAQADYDGDGKTDMAVWRPSNFTWYVILSSTGATFSPSFGTALDTPFPADFDGDGKADLAVWRNSTATFYSTNSSNGAIQINPFGTVGDRPACADYDGDGKDDLAVFRDSNATWYIGQSSNLQTIQVPWGAAGDNLVQNDYDGDGKVDIATWRPANGNWYIRQSASNNSLRQVSWGLPGDTPVPAYYRR